MNDSTIALALLPRGEAKPTGLTGKKAGEDRQADSYYMDRRERKGAAELARTRPREGSLGWRSTKSAGATLVVAGPPSLLSLTLHCMPLAL